MKKLLSLIILSILVCFSAQAKEYTFEKTKLCSYDERLTCDLNNIAITGLLKLYHPNGSLQVEVNYKDGKEEGLAKGYHENGNLKAEAYYKDGKVEGLAKFYHENGNLLTEAYYKDGKRDGLAKTYYENGNLLIEAYYKDDKLEGLTKIYYKNGNLKFELNFKDDKAVSGYMYDIYGKRTKMTNAHLHNLTKDLPKAD